MFPRKVTVKVARQNGSFDEGIRLLKGRSVKFDAGMPRQVSLFGISFSLICISLISRSSIL